MFSFDPTFGFLMLTGGSKGNIGKDDPKRDSSVNAFFLNSAIEFMLSLIDRYLAEVKIVIPLHNLFFICLYIKLLYFILLYPKYP